MEADDATRNPEIFLQTLDRNPDGFLSEIRRKTTACFPIFQHTKMSLRLMVGAS